MKTQGLWQPLASFLFLKPPPGTQREDLENPEVVLLNCDEWGKVTTDLIFRLRATNMATLGHWEKPSACGRREQLN